MRLSISVLVFAFSLPMLAQPAEAAPLKGMVQRAKQYVKNNKTKLTTIARRTTRGVLIAGGGALAAYGASKGVYAENVILLGIGVNMMTTGALARSKDFATRVAVSIGIGSVANSLVGGMAGAAIGDEIHHAAATIPALLTKGVIATANATGSAGPARMK